LFVLIFSCSCGGEHYSGADIRNYQADIASIRNWLAEYNDAVNNADIERILACLSEDVCYLPPDKPLISGRENLRKWYSAYFNHCSPSENFNLTDFKVFGDFACLQGTYTISGKLRPDGESFSQKGKYINYYIRRDGGGWLCTRSIWNSDSRIFDIHSLIPADFSGKWKLDILRSTHSDDLASMTLFIDQDQNELILNRTLIRKDTSQINSIFRFKPGSEIISTSESGTLITRADWNSDRQELIVNETLRTLRKGENTVYRRTSVYSLTAQGEVLNVVSDDSSSDTSFSNGKNGHSEMVYMRL
jgi:ketosteroid isomerase-like protein